MESITQASGGSRRKCGPAKGGGATGQGTPSDRLPPHSLEAEAGVLGCCVIAALECLNACEERGVAPEWCYDLRHQLIYGAMTSLQQAGRAIDVITLQQFLRDAGNLDQVGGVTYLCELADKVPSAAHLPHYLDILEEKWIARRLLHTCTEIGARLYEKESNARDLVASATHDLLLLGESATARPERTLGKLAYEVMPELEKYERGKAQSMGLNTGLAYVDKLLCGFGGEAGNYVVIGARPGTGKTALATQILLELSLGPHALPVYFFSMEMNARALTKRMIFQHARADLQRWRTGFAEAEDIPKVTTAGGEFLKVKNFYLDESKRLTIDALSARARRAVRSYGVKCFGVDYLQLLQSRRFRHRPDRVQEMAEISEEIQSLSGELNVPFIVLAQLNRDWEKEQTRKPRLSDLKDCGSIEQDADIVGLLYRARLKDKKKEQFEAAVLEAYGKDWSKKPLRINALWEKNRNGMTGDSELLFERWCTRFADYGEWLKAHGGGEELRREREDEEVDREMPSNEEMNL